MTPSYLVTHSGGFHADELCSSAVLTQLFPQADIIRSRAPEWISPAADRIVYDVGGTYDPAQRIFDHHQRNAPTRPDGSPFSSFGLIWKHFGEEFLRSLTIPEDQIAAIHAAVDADFVHPIDQLDNGAIDPSEAGLLTSLTLPTLLETLKPVFDKSNASAEAQAFEQALGITQSLLKAQVAQCAARLRAKRLVQTAIDAAGQGRVLELPMGMPFQSALKDAGADHLLFVVHPRGTDWSIGGIRKYSDSFELRADLPAKWAGLSHDALEAASGVAGASFCHNGRFIAAAKTRSAILELAEIAVETALANDPSL